MGRPSTPPVDGLLREILFDPERDHCPGARPVVSFTTSDDEDYARACQDRASAEIELRRRGRKHGCFVELEPAGLVRSIPRKRRVVQWAMRWNAAKPVVRHGLMEDDVQSADVKALVRLRKRLAKPNGLASWLDERSEDLSPRFSLCGKQKLVDPERDLGKVGVQCGAVDDLWLKTGQLSTFTADESTRLRFSFGLEGPDDASQDEERHALVRELFEQAVPGGALIRHPELLAETEKMVGGPVAFTQPILYWNAPEGGALFHHDAFDATAEQQQAGVLYMQLEGRTAWLALSIGDLALRVREFIDGLSDQDRGLAKALDVDALTPLAADWSALVRELGEPGQGRFGALVNRGPEFTAFLADSGHAAIVGPGDVIWLPNHGLERTAMHSVFCASPRVATGLSLAIRHAAPQERSEPVDGANAPS